MGCVRLQNLLPASDVSRSARFVINPILPAHRMEEFDLVVGSPFLSYKVQQLLGDGAYGKAYSMTEHDQPRELVVLKVQLKQWSARQIETEVRVLSSLPQSCQFSTMICQGTIGDVYNFIIMTHCGISLHKMLKRTDNFCFNLENTIRIGCQLFDLVHLFHSFGWLHRDLHWGNVTINTDSYRRLKMSLIDFGLCVSKNGPHVAEVISQWHSSLQASYGHSFTATDDFVSVVFLLMRCLNVEPFGEERESIESRKAHFHRSHEGILTDEYRWIWTLYKTVDSQRSTGIDINVVKTQIKSVNENFDSNTKITYTKRDGLVIID